MLRNTLERLLRHLTTDAETAQSIIGDLEEEARRGRGGDALPRAGVGALLGVIAHLAVARSWRLTIAICSAPFAGSDLVLNEARHALRRLRRSPGYVVAAVAIIALGVGVNTAVFAVVDTVFFRSLGYEDPSKLVDLRLEGRRFPLPFTPGEFQRLREHLRGSAARDVAAYRWQNEAVVSDRDQAWLRGSAGVSTNLLDVLGSAPALGRGFVRADGEPGAPPVVMVSHAFWRSALGARPDVVGQVLRLDDGRYARGVHEIIGVTSPEFAFPDRTVDFWVPIRVDPADSSTFQARSENIRILARLTGGDGGAAIAEATRALSSTLSGREWRITATPFRDVLTGAQEVPLRILALVSLLILVIATVNLAGLVLAREMRRRHDLGVRTALGATRRRLALLPLLDAALLGVIGGGAGIGVGVATVPLLLRTLPSEISAFGAVSLRGPALWSGLVIACVGVLALGLAPLIRGVTGSLDLPGISRGSGLGPGRVSRVRRGLVIAQVAVSLPLAIAAGSLLHSVSNLDRVNAGVDPADVWTLRLDVRSVSMTALNQFFEQVLADIRKTPGVAEATVMRSLPFSGGSSQTNVGLAPQAEAGQSPLVDYQVVHSGFFRTLGVPLLSGRDFAPGDAGDAPAVAIVNQRFVEVHLDGVPAVGRTVYLGDRPARIVGVVGDVRVRQLREAPRPQLFVPYGQIPNARGTRMLLVRTLGTGLRLVQTLDARIRAIDPGVAIGPPQSLAAVLRGSIARERGLATLVSVCAMLAFLLSGVGLFGLLSYLVTARAAEFALRRALGGTAADQLRLVGREAGSLVMAGLAVGIPGAVALQRILHELLYAVSPIDPIVVVATALVTTCMALLASWLPARRAMRADPRVWLSETR